MLFRAEFSDESSLEYGLEIFLAVAIFVPSHPTSAGPNPSAPAACPPSGHQ